MLPHIKNSQAGVNKWDPAHTNLFEVYFTIPEALRAEFGADEAIITEHVQSISGIKSLDNGPEKIEQKFMGTTRTYLSPKLGSTSHELTVTLSLNLRNGTDNYLYKLFKAWNKLCYDLDTGETTIKKDYCADWLKISIANRRGEIYREILYKDVILFDGLDVPDELSYESNEPAQMTIKFASDWAEEQNI